MSFLSRLRPESAVTVGLGTAAGVYAIYSQALPNMTDVRMTDPHNEHVESQRKAAAYKSAALVLGVFAITRDLNAFIISGGALVGIDYMYKHANGIHPQTGKLDATRGGESIAPSLAESYPLPDYSESDVA